MGRKENSVFPPGPTPDSGPQCQFIASARMPDCEFGLIPDSDCAAAGSLPGIRPGAGVDRI